jgi:energy-coupling factor transporter ATP-binding protein EcfA2
MTLLKTLAVANYRSIRSLVVPLGELTLVTGANGSGKSNVYSALRLLSEAAQGGIVASLAKEGGLASTLWAGPEQVSRRMKAGEIPGPRTQAVALRLGFMTEAIGYCIDLGLPARDMPPKNWVRPQLRVKECSMPPHGVGLNVERSSEVDLKRKMPVTIPCVSRSFPNNGYLVVPNVLSSQDIDDVARSISEIKVIFVVPIIFLARLSAMLQRFLGTFTNGSHVPPSGWGVPSANVLPPPLNEYSQWHPRFTGIGLPLHF